MTVLTVSLRRLGSTAGLLVAVPPRDVCAAQPGPAGCAEALA